MCHWQLKLLKYEFQKTGYSSCFFILTHILKGKIHIIERKPLQLSVSFSDLYHFKLGLNCKSWQWGNVITCWKLQVIFKIQIKLCNNFRFKHSIFQIPTSNIFFKFQCAICNKSYYGEWYPIKVNILVFHLSTVKGFNLEWIVMSAIIC